MFSEMMNISSSGSLEVKGQEEDEEEEGERNPGKFSC